MTTFEIRSPLAEEIGALAECLGVAFGGRMPDRVIDLLATDLPLERTIAVFDGLEVVGTAGSDGVAITLPGGTRTPVAAVTMVSVAPTHRRRGLLTAMMREQLDGVHERGEHVAALYASEGSIYGRFGYGVATYGSRFVIDKRRTVARQPAEHFPGSVRLLGRAHALEAFPAVHAAGLTARPGEIDRMPYAWPELLAEVAEPSEQRETFYAAYEVDGRIDGYVVYRVTPFDASLGNEGRAVMLDELFGLTPAAERALWHFLVGIDLTSEVRTRARPVDDPLPLLFGDARAVRTVQVADRLWLRLVDVAAALGDRRYGAPGELVLEIDDQFCAWNSGRYRLVVDDRGEATVTRADGDAPDLVLPVDALASIYLGGTTARRLAGAGRCASATPDALATADRMFASDRAPYCAASF